MPFFVLITRYANRIILLHIAFIMYVLSRSAGYFCNSLVNSMILETMHLVNNLS